jgi:O-antigen/teichoic acid export membrane protein
MARPMSEPLRPSFKKTGRHLSHIKTSTARSSDRRLAATIGKNTIYGVVASAVQVATRFVMVPVVISHLGLGGYGIWSIVMATAGYMRFGSAGLKSAFQKYVAEATGTGDFETANKLLSTGSISMLVLSIVGLIPLAIYSHSLAKLGGVPSEFLAAAAGSITLLAVILAIANFGAAFEAIVMGGHRIDLTRTFNIITTTGEAIAIILLLHFGRGLFAMAATVAVSELAFVICCYFAARRVVPEISVSPRHFTTSVFRELIRYAGSYQLVNILEVLYSMLLPVIVLRYFGAEIAGVYAVATRLVTAALMGQDALILPLLSGGTLVFASGSAERLARFFRKSFKITMAVTLAPLAFVATFGTLLVFAWTGQTSPQFSVAIWLTCFSSFFNSISRLQLILYRASGNALHDNIRQAFRLLTLIVLAMSGRFIGFGGVLAALCVVEFIGVVYMFMAMTSTLNFFNLRILVPDALRLVAATSVVIAAGAAVTAFSTSTGASTREGIMLKLGEIVLACLAVAWPAVALTKSVSTAERRMLLDFLTPWKKTIVGVYQ